MQTKIEIKNLDTRDTRRFNLPVTRVSFLKMI